jgi:hypothetical protein
MRKRKMIYRDFECTVCGFKITIPKRKCKSTDIGHLKEAYCFQCKENRTFEQVGIK